MLKVAYSELYPHPLPAGHRFPMLKYELIPEQLLYEGIVQSASFFEPIPVDEQSVLCCHDAGYWLRLKNEALTDKEARRIGFPQSYRLVLREITITGGTISCCDYARQFGVSLNVSGGTHHAFADRGEGFCLLNDVAIAAQYQLDHSLAQRVLIIDLDVHQGNGTAKLFEHDPRVFTFSMHGKANFPLIKEQSSFDIALETGTDDAYFLKTLAEHLPRIIDLHQPDLAIYVAGVDVLASDRLGKLSLTLGGCAARDKFVFETCRKNAIPVAVVMAGGYSPAVKDIVDAHCNTYKMAQWVYF